MQAHSNIKALFFCPNGRYLFSFVASGDVLLWDTRTGKLACPAVQQHDWTLSPKMVLFGPNGRYALTLNGVNDLPSTLWDLKTVRPIRSFALSRTGQPGDAQFSRDSRRLIYAGPYPRIWDCATGLPLTPVLPHNEEVNAAAFNPDGSRVVTACADGYARIWGATTGESLTPPLLHLRSVGSACFSGNGRYIATGSEDGTARLWDAHTGEAITPPLKQDDPVESVAFVIEDSRLLVTGAHSVALWDIPVDRRPLPTLLSLSDLLSGQRIVSGITSREVTPQMLAAGWRGLGHKE
jgi:hypothetical protein